MKSSSNFFLSFLVITFYFCYGENSVKRFQYKTGVDDGTPVTVYSLSGSVLQNTTVQQGRIRLNGRNKGVYAIQLGTLGSTLIRL